MCSAILEWNSLTYHYIMTSFEKKSLYCWNKLFSNFDEYKFVDLLPFTLTKRKIESCNITKEKLEQKFICCIMLLEFYILI
jgi:hypothetical protein